MAIIKIKFADFLNAMKSIERSIEGSGIEGGHIVFDTGEQGKDLMWAYDPPEEIMIKGHIFRIYKEAK
jgi:hypothetical protein